MILSSEYFLIPRTGELPIDRINRWYANINRKAGDYRVTVSLESLESGRQKKVSAKAELARLAVDEVLDGKDVWEKDTYRFCFVSRKYWWRNEEIHVTDGEALFLFRRLVLDDSISKSQMYYLQNLRKRLGSDFLKGVLA